MKASLVIILSLCIGYGYAQECDTYMRITRASPSSTAEFHHPIDINGALVNGVFTSQVKALVFNLTKKEGGNCVDKGNAVNITFTDKTVLTLKTSLTNCEKRILIFFDTPESKQALEELKAKQIESFSIDMKKGPVQIDLSQDSAVLLKNSIKCLVEYFRGTDYPRMNTIPASIVKDRDSAAARVDTAQVYMIVEKQPEYKGGYEAMMDFIKTNVRFPKFARQHGLSGTVTVRFIINRNGTVTDEEVLRSSGHDVLDEEALRVAKKMPDWLPGTMFDVPVKVFFNLPIRFNPPVVLRR